MGCHVKGSIDLLARFCTDRSILNLRRQETPNFKLTSKNTGKTFRPCISWNVERLYSGLEWSFINLLVSHHGGQISRQRRGKIPKFICPQAVFVANFPSSDAWPMFLFLSALLNALSAGVQRSLALGGGGQFFASLLICSYHIISFVVAKLPDHSSISFNPRTGFLLLEEGLVIFVKILVLLLRRLQRLNLAAWFSPC